MNDQTLYQAGPDEMIEYARFQEIVSGNVLGPLPSETHHDVIVAISGAGVVRWDGTDHELTNGEAIVLPHGARYELEPAPEQDLHVMIFGIAPKTPIERESA